ncbi:hypothetical protein DdX_14513 [Ditylenchus destructor]|uniref:Uncharacterized protein n=1 Tax=Ditylenchus destructor TaxID=166010 RepID=A0AAD4MWV4_9BILA|nr:hypothetical protein DdX_14513 [Ditylenchus destructor]
MPQKSNYLPYLNFAETVVTFLCHVINIYTMSKMVYHRFYRKSKYPRVRSLSPAVVIFLAANAYCSLLNQPYYAMCTSAVPLALCLNYLFSMTKKNSIVKFTIVTELCLNLLPGYFGLLFRSVTGETSAQYFGIYPTMFCAIDAALCGTYYLTVLSKRSSTVTTSVVSISANSKVHQST